MKILNLQRFSDVGGAERFYVDFLPALVSRGHEVHFLFVGKRCNRDNIANFEKTLNDAGVKTHLLEAERALSPKLLLAIRKLLRREKFDIVQANLNHSEVWLALLDVLGWNDTPWISVKHGFSDAYQARHGFDATKLRPGVLAWGTRWAARRAHRVVAISKGLAKFLVEGRLVAQSKIEIVPYGFTFTEPARRAPLGNFRYGPRQIIMVGRLVPVKQQAFGIEIAARLREEFPDLKMVIVGDGILMDSLREQANNSRFPEMFHFAGFQKQVSDYIRDSDLMLFPSRSEGFGLVILEAWNEAVPVVAFDVPACNEIIEDGVNGFLVPPFDTQLMTDKVSLLLRDQKRCRSYGEAGHKAYVAEYQIGSMVDRYVQIYKDVSMA